jgi:hypothetical protein
MHDEIERERPEPRRERKDTDRDRNPLEARTAAHRRWIGDDEDACRGID